MLLLELEVCGSLETLHGTALVSLDLHSPCLLDLELLLLDTSVLLLLLVIIMMVSLRRGTIV
jgi:hypothetical protein